MPEQPLGETPAGNNENKPSSSPQPETPPASGANGGAQATPNKEGNSPDIASLIRGEIEKAFKPIVGRVTKLEQKNKGKTISPNANQGQSFTFEEEPEVPQPSKDELEIAQEKELLRVEKGITRLTRNPEYQSILESDKTLARILDANPLALLDNSPRDADDALEQIQAILDDRLASTQNNKQLETGKDDKPITPEPVPTNPPAVENKKGEKSEQKMKTPEEVGASLANKLLGK